MFRILKESYKTYNSDFENNYDDFRYMVMEPFGLVFDADRYLLEKSSESEKYKKISDFIWLLSNDIEKYSTFSSMIWTLESRGVVGHYYGILTQEEFEEQIKIVRMFLRLSYWN